MRTTPFEKKQTHKHPDDYRHAQGCLNARHPNNQPKTANQIDSDNLKIYLEERSKIEKSGIVMTRCYDPKINHTCSLWMFGYRLDGQLRDDGVTYFTCKNFPGFHFLLSAGENAEKYMQPAFSQFTALYRKAQKANENA